MPTLESERSGRVLVVRVDNPPHNFMDRSMVAELDALTRGLARDGSVGSVVITGRPPELFVTHYDVAEILAGVEDVGVTPGPRAAGALLRPRRRDPPGAGPARRGRAHPAARAAGAAPPPRRLRAHEPARQGRDRRDQRPRHRRRLRAGSGLRPSLHRGQPGVMIGLPEMTMGFNPGAGGTQRLTRALGPGPALEAMLEGRTFTAAEAVEAGIVHRAVEPDRLQAEAMETAERMARRSPGSVRALKVAVYEGGSRACCAAWPRSGAASCQWAARSRAPGDVRLRGRGGARDGSPWANPEGIGPWQRGEVEDLGRRRAGLVLGALRPPRDPGDHRAHPRRSLRELLVVELLDPEAGVREGVGGGAVRMAAAGDPSPGRSRRSCQQASRCSRPRTCSRNSSAPPSTSTRAPRPATAAGSSTVQSTSVETTVSKLPSSNGSSSARASTTSTAGPRPAPPRAGRAAARPCGVGLGQHQLGDRVRVVGQVEPGAGAELQRPARAPREQQLGPHLGQAGLLGAGEHAVVDARRRSGARARQMPQLA